MAVLAAEAPLPARRFKKSGCANDAAIGDHEPEMAEPTQFAKKSAPDMAASLTMLQLPLPPDSTLSGALPPQRARRRASEASAQSPSSGSGVGSSRRRRSSSKTMIASSPCSDLLGSRPGRRRDSAPPSSRKGNDIVPPSLPGLASGVFAQSAKRIGTADYDSNIVCDSSNASHAIYPEKLGKEEAHNLEYTVADLDACVSCAAYRSKAGVEAKRRRTAEAALCAAQTELKFARTSGARDARTVARLEWQAADRDARSHAQLRTIAEQEAAIEELRSCLRDQVNDQMRFLQGVRDNQGLAQRCLDEARSEASRIEANWSERDAHRQRLWNLERETLLEEAQDAEDCIEELEDELETSRQTSSLPSPASGSSGMKVRSGSVGPPAAAAYLHSEKNLSHEVSRAEKGAVLEKVCFRSRKRQRRFVRIDGTSLVWGKDLRGTRSSSRLNLEDVIRIDYGRSARACALHPELPTWLCFSLYTARRSFDFCGLPGGELDEDTVRCFVLGISCICRSTCGTVPTRGRFAVQKVLCKLDAHCVHSGLSRGQLFLRAIERTARELAKPGCLDDNRRDISIAPVPNSQPTAAAPAGDEPRSRRSRSLERRWRRGRSRSEPRSVIGGVLSTEQRAQPPLSATGPPSPAAWFYDYALDPSAWGPHNRVIVE